MIFTSGHPRVVVSAARTLNEVARSSNGAQAVVDADVFDFLPELLRSRRADIRHRTAGLLGTLAKYEAGLRLILTSNLCTQLLAMLR
jgi:hypothetical protein